MLFPFVSKKCVLCMTVFLTRRTTLLGIKLVNLELEIKKMFFLLHWLLLLARLMLDDLMS